MNLEEIIKLLKQSAIPDRAEHEKNYMRSNLEFFGITNPVKKHIAKQIFQSSAIPYSLLNKMWKTENFDIMYTALYLIDFYIRSPKHKTGQREWIFLNKIAKDIENWGHNDQLCGSRSFFHKREDFIPTMKKWSKSKNPWLRRQAAVSLLARQPVHIPFPFQKAVSVLEQILYDNEYYVQKGVGWMFRELHNQYPEKTRSYLRNHRDAPRIVLRTACEKMSNQQKEKIL